MRDRSEKLREDLVKHLKAEGAVRTGKVERAMLGVPRELFVQGASLREAYLDRPLSIGSGQTISAPHMVAIMAEELDLEEGLKVLEIGGGSGYHAAVVSRIIGESGKVISLEVLEPLARKARRSLSEASVNNVSLIHGDGSVGYPEEAPYDRIYYTCAAPFVPDEVISQLGTDGLLLSVEGDPNSTQKLIAYRRSPSNGIDRKLLTYCVFVPLVGKYGHRP